jgi:hypothetical protein
MTDEFGPSGGPHDAAGQRIDIYQIVQIEEVPEYLFRAHLMGNPLEAELGKRIKGLTNAFCLVMPPDNAPDLRWHSRDCDYVFLCCKSVECDSAEVRPYIWTYAEYFPTKCLRVVPGNIFIYGIFFEGPINASRDCGPDDARVQYLRSVRNSSLVDLMLDHDEAMRNFLQKHNKG